MTSLNHDNPGNRLEEISVFLRRLPMFRDTPVEVLKLYAYLTQQEKFSAGDTIIEQGRPSDRMYLVIKGTVAICEQRHGRNLFIQELGDTEYNYFGELALLARFDWFFNVRAVTDVSLLSISRKAFLKIHEQFPELYAASVEKIVQLRIDRFVHQMNYLIDHLSPEAWKECTSTKKEQRSMRQHP